MIDFIKSKGGANTNDATATANDILNPKTAYVANGKVTGNIMSNYISDSSSVINSTLYTVENFDNQHMGTLLNAHNKYLVVQNNQLNIYEITSTSLNLVTSINLSDIGLTFEAVRSSIFDNSKGIYNLIFYNFNDSTGGTIGVCTYNPITNELNILDSALEFGGNYYKPTAVIPSPINANYLLIQYRNNFNLNDIYLINLSQNIPQTSELITTGDGNSIQGYSWNNLNYISFNNSKLKGTYKFNEDTKELQLISSCAKNGNTYTLVTSSLDGSRGICIDSNNKYYYCNISFNDLTFDISNIIEMSSDYIIDIFTSQNDILLVTKSNKMYYLQYQNNTFKEISVNTSATAFNNKDLLSTGVIVSADSKKAIYFVSSTSLNMDTFTPGNNQILNSLQIASKTYRDTSDADSLSSDLLINKIAYGQSGKITGTMPNNGELNYTPSAQAQTIPAGYTSGGRVLGDSNLLAENIKSGVTIFGITGTYTGETTNIVEEE